jgi:plasmid maintenance system killer protein
MIQRFRSKALKRFYERGEVKHIKPDHRETVRDILLRGSTLHPPLKT